MNKTYLLLVAIGLYVLSVAIQKNEDRKYSKSNVQQKIQQNITTQEANFLRLIDNKNLLKNLTSTAKFSDATLANSYGCLFYKLYNDSLKLITWNTNYFIDQKNIFSKDTSFLTQNNSGYFEIVCKKITVQDSRFIAVAIIPVKCNFNIKNSNNSFVFVGFSNLHKYYDIEKKATPYPIKSINNSILFYLKKTQESFFFSYNNTTIIVRLLAILYLFFYINNLSKVFHKKYGFEKAFAFLFCSIILVRVLSYSFKFPFVFSKLPLFDPSIYASNFLHPSLGDLLINSLLLFWITSFSTHKKNNAYFNAKTQRYLALPVIFLIIITILTFIFSNGLKSLVIDSKIPFDVSNYFKLNIYTGIALIIIGLLVINYFKICSYLFKLIMQSKLSIYLCFGTLIFINIVCVFLQSIYNHSSTVYNIILVCWLLLFALLLFFENRKDTNEKKMEVLSIFWILFFTTSIAASLVFFENKLEVAQRKQAAEKIYFQNYSTETRDHTAHEKTDYYYAVYKFGNIVEQVGNYIFPKNQEQLNVEFTEMEQGDISKIIYKAANNYSVVIIKKHNNFLNFITLFSYLFFSLLLVVSAIYLIINLTKPNFNTRQIFSATVNIKTQIQATITFTTVVCFIVIGIVSIYFYINRFRVANENKNIKVLDACSEQLKTINIADDSTVKMQLQKLSALLITDLNVYNISGKLVATSQPEYFKNEIVNTQINYKAFTSIYANKELMYKAEESIGDIEFTSFYKPLISNNGEIIGCINLPDLSYQKTIKQDLSSFIASLISLNAFIFLIAGAIAFLITNRITSTFALIKNKMKALNWQTHNEEIIWNRNDEIGALVTEYNIMVKKLDETAKAFALSQKEIAWKEMAKQVAHEIKNPLTPMKLSIQYLQNKINEDSPNIKQLSKTVATTLIEQINQLSNIASDFSQFANIGNDKPEKFNVNEIVVGLIDLYKTDENIIVEHNLLENKNIVFADKIQLGRLFTNLIKNAIEASVNNKILEIFIQQQNKNNKVIIAIKDNGTGIPVDIQEKIFTLNFTTKSSGTGLGLAICKGIIDNANGSIWFKTDNSGTTFFVELPLVN